MSTATLNPPMRPVRPAAPVASPGVGQVDPRDVELMRYRFSSEDYYRISELGILDGKRTELVDGHIFVMPAQKDTHPIALTLAMAAVNPLFDAKQYWVRPNAPLQISGFEPEPDISVIAGTVRGWRGRGHPPSALLAIEISDTSLRYDRGAKAGLYASAGILDYWIINLVDGVLEVHRDPTRDPAATFGHRYADVRVLDAAASVSPLAMPSATIKVADLLP